MNWLAQNWLWLAFVALAVLLMARRGGCAMGHGGHRVVAAKDGDASAGAAPGPWSRTKARPGHQRHGCC